MRPWARFKANTSAALHEAGQKVAYAITNTQRAGARVALVALGLGLIAGAALVWLGVSLGRQPT